MHAACSVSMGFTLSQPPPTHLGELVHGQLGWVQAMACGNGVLLEQAAMGKGCAAGPAEGVLHHVSVCGKQVLRQRPFVHDVDGQCLVADLQGAVALANANGVVRRCTAHVLLMLLAFAKVMKRHRAAATKAQV